MVLIYKFPHIRRTHIFLLSGKSVLKIKLIQAQLIRHNYIHIIRHTARDPVMTTNGLQPPDLVLILECDSVHLIGAILLQKASQTFHPFSGAANIGKYNINQVFFSQPSRDFRCILTCRLIGHQRVSAKNARIGGDRFCSCHTYASFIHAACSPDPHSFYCVWHSCVSHGIRWQLHFHMRKL